MIINEPTKYTSARGEKFEIIINSFETNPGVTAEMFFQIKKDGESEILWDYRLKLNAPLGHIWNLGQGPIPGEQGALEELGFLKIKIEIEKKDKNYLLTPQNSEATYYQEKNILQSELDGLLNRK